MPFYKSCTITLASKERIKQWATLEIPKQCDYPQVAHRYDDKRNTSVRDHKITADSQSEVTCVVDIRYISNASIANANIVLPSTSPDGDYGCNKSESNAVSKGKRAFFVMRLPYAKVYSTIWRNDNIYAQIFTSKVIKPNFFSVPKFLQQNLLWVNLPWMYYSFSNTYTANIYLPYTSSYFALGFIIRNTNARVNTPQYRYTLARKSGVINWSQNSIKLCKHALYYSTDNCVFTKTSLKKVTYGSVYSHNANANTKVCIPRTSCNKHFAKARSSIQLRSLYPFNRFTDTPEQPSRYAVTQVAQAYVSHHRYTPPSNYGVHTHARNRKGNLDLHTDAQQRVPKIQWYTLNYHCESFSKGSNAQAISAPYQKVGEPYCIHIDHTPLGTNCNTVHNKRRSTRFTHKIWKIRKGQPVCNTQVSSKMGAQQAIQFTPAFSPSGVAQRKYSIRYNEDRPTRYTGSNTFIISAQSQCHTPKNCESSTQCTLDTFYGMYGISRTLMPAHARTMASTGYQPSGDVFGSDPIHWLRRNRVSRHKQVSKAVNAYRPLEADAINDNESKRFAEVNLADTLNYRTLKPIKGGLFCETLFGPIKDWECQCGRLKFTRAPKTELWCPSCVVQITRSVIRRVRMAYINLAAPVMHIWYKKQSNNPLVQVLSLNAKDITSVLDAKSLCIASPEWVTCCTPSMSIFDFHIWQNEVYPFIKGEKGSFDVDVPWNTFYSLPENLNACASGRAWVAHAFSYFKDTSTFAFSQLFTRLSYKEGLLYIQYKLSLLHSLGYSHRSLLHKQMFSYLCNYHSNREGSSARKAMHTPLQILQKKKHLLHSYTLFKRTLGKSHAAHSWHIGTHLNSLFLKYIPVLPPDLRPIIQVESGKFATSDVNDLYRFVIFRNNRLKRFLQQNVPEAIFYQELRLVQHSVDALFDNGKLKQPISRSSMYEDFEPLKSLSDRLVGKRGRFRLNLLGKRVDYSGRSVIVVGPKLRLFQCGLPIKMAFELFFPFLIQYVLKKALAKTTKSAKVFLREHPKVVKSALGEIVHSHPVILNRAPTLHRMGVQSFFPVLVEGKAIQLHPLMCPSFNADFDGDQMAVHIPLRLQSHIECRFLMLSAHNWLSPANGESIINLSQDMVLGFYYLTFASAYNHHSKDTKAIVNKGCKLHDMFWINFNEYASSFINEGASHSYMITRSTLNESITTCVVSRTGWLYKMYATRVKLEDSFAKYRLLYVLTSVGRMIFNNYLFWRI